MPRSQFDPRTTRLEDAIEAARLFKWPGSEDARQLLLWSSHQMHDWQGPPVFGPCKACRRVGSTITDMRCLSCGFSPKQRVQNEAKRLRPTCWVASHGRRYMAVCGPGQWTCNANHAGPCEPSGSPCGGVPSRREVTFRDGRCVEDGHTLACHEGWPAVVCGKKGKGAT